jgi:two-component system LytT family response regulator
MEKVILKAIVVDDERLARKELINLLKAHDDIEIAGEAANAEEALDLIRDTDPDIVFLDIQMPGRNGFELLEELERVPQVIFVTAFDEYALKAFEVSALDYLLKPVETERLAQAIDKVRSGIKEQEKKERENTNPASHLLGLNDQIFLKDGDKCWFVRLEDIRLFESEGNYVRVYFKSNKPLILKSLNALEERLDSKSFFRANRKHIVNLQWIDQVENWFNGGLRLTLLDSTQVEVSRRQAARFRDLLSL